MLWGDASALDYLAQAAELGHPGAGMIFGDFYRKGEYGLAKDYAKAARYYALNPEPWGRAEKDGGDLPPGGDAGNPAERRPGAAGERRRNRRERFVQKQRLPLGNGGEGRGYPEIGRAHV